MRCTSGIFHPAAPAGHSKETCPPSAGAVRPSGLPSRRRTGREGPGRSPCWPVHTAGRARRAGSATPPGVRDGVHGETGGQRPRRWEVRDQRPRMSKMSGHAIRRSGHKMDICIYVSRPLILLDALRARPARHAQRGQSRAAALPTQAPGSWSPVLIPAPERSTRFSGATWEGAAVDGDGVG